MSDRRVVMGMSTIPSRIDALLPSIESLRAQTRVPDQIYVSIPEFSRRESCAYDIPPSLAEAHGQGILQIVRSPADYGPGTKLLGCLDELNDSDIFICVDDDVLYEPFMVEEIVRSVTRTGGSASFYVYESWGLKIGQGADGYGMTGKLARSCAAMIPLVARHDELRLHDDFWISFALRRQGIVPDDLFPLCARYGVDVVHQNRQLANPLADMQGAHARRTLNRRCHTILFRDAGPTPSMRFDMLGGITRGALRTARERLGRAVSKLANR